MGIRGHAKRGYEDMDGMRNTRRSAEEVAEILAGLHDQHFRSKRIGKYRISRDALRIVCGRHKLPERFVGEVASELFERGYVLVDLETYLAVMSQKLFESYRRATTGTVQRLLASSGDSSNVQP